MDLLAAGRFPPLVEAFLQGRSLELLSPVRFLAPGELPTGDCSASTPDRGELATALAGANREYGHPDAARLSEKLADAATRVVITGQQPGLFGGPLYTLSKAVAAALWAERLQAAGEPAVALFWMATEDHDFRESSRAAFFSSQGLSAIDLGEDREPLVPVGLRVLGPKVNSVLAELQQVMPGDRYGDWLEQLGDWYKPEASFGEAFARLMVALMGERCPLLVDAMLPDLKRAQRPWLRRIVEQRAAVGKTFAERDREITAAGYPLQVKPQPGSSPLFLQQGRERRRIEWRGADRLTLRGDEEFEQDIDWLLEIIGNDPGRVSPGVRARSAIQDAVLGSCLQILGPGELSYLPQAAPLFDLLQVPAPMVALRPQVLVMDERQQTKVTDSGLALEELLDPKLDLDRRLARPEDTRFLAGAEDQLEELLESLQTPAMALDGNLERPWQKTSDQMRRALQAFGNRVTAAAARRDETTRARLESLRGYCLPVDRLQERVIATAHFPGKYGASFVAAMFEQMDLDPTNLRLISP